MLFTGAIWGMRKERFLYRLILKKTIKVYRPTLSSKTKLIAMGVLHENLMYLLTYKNATVEPTFSIQYKIILSLFQKTEKDYRMEMARGSVTNQTQFDYAWCLVRTASKHNLQTGANMLEGKYYPALRSQHIRERVSLSENVRKSLTSAATKCTSFLSGMQFIDKSRQESNDLCIIFPRIFNSQN